MQPLHGCWSSPDGEPSQLTRCRQLGQSSWGSPADREMKRRFVALCWFRMEGGTPRLAKYRSYISSAPGLSSRMQIFCGWKPGADTAWKYPISKCCLDFSRDKSVSQGSPQLPAPAPRHGDPPASGTAACCCRGLQEARSARAELCPLLEQGLWPALRFCFPTVFSLPALSGP